STWSSSERTPRRAARRATCCTDSSAHTYSTLPCSCAKLWLACRSRVDFPMPGSPPISTTDPGTTPPPSTRSSSAMPVRLRLSREGSTSLSRRTAARAASSGVGGAGASGTRLFHAWHDGQRPSHRGDSYPHCWQANLIRAALVAILPSRPRRGCQERGLPCDSDSIIAFESPDPQPQAPAPPRGHKTARRPLRGHRAVLGLLPAVQLGYLTSASCFFSKTIWPSALASTTM